jgi:hypothetical protein
VTRAAACGCSSSGSPASMQCGLSMPDSRCSWTACHHRLWLSCCCRRLGCLAVQGRDSCEHSWL